MPGSISARRCRLGEPVGGRAEDRIRPTSLPMERIRRPSARTSARCSATSLAKAVRLRASDLHLEPLAPAARVRLRVDGAMLTLEQTVPMKQFVQLVSRIKVMGGMDITVKRLPQDGRFQIRAGGRPLEVRASILPCQGGEKAVLRLLDPERQFTNFDSLVASKSLAGLFRDLFLAPSGLVLVCGPTGSGKTSTLYAGLNEIWRTSPTVNILTVEDPVEYQVPFATQVPVNRAVGLDFAHILRTVLRQDPDILLVGEIRDAESALIALEAATTGHLVLSSLHTDMALESIGRLVEPRLQAVVRSRQRPAASSTRCWCRASVRTALAWRCRPTIRRWRPPRPRLRQRRTFFSAVRRGGDVRRVASSGRSAWWPLFETLSVDEPLRNLIVRGRCSRSCVCCCFIRRTSYRASSMRDICLRRDSSRRSASFGGVPGDPVCRRAVRRGLPRRCRRTRMGRRSLSEPLCSLRRLALSVADRSVEHAFEIATQSAEDSRLGEIDGVDGQLQLLGDVGRGSIADDRLPAGLPGRRLEVRRHEPKRSAQDVEAKLRFFLLLPLG